MEASEVQRRRLGRPPNDPVQGTAIGARIAARRVALAIYQAELAQQIGVGRSVVSEWESGVKTPSVQIVPALCRALSLTPNDLFGWKDGDH